MKHKDKIILIVEDDEDLQAIYTFSFKKQGYSVECVSDARGVLCAVKEKKPSLVLLDFLLGEINGLKVLEELKKIPETKDVPVVILTNYTDGEVVKDALDGGAEDVIMKADFSPRELVKKISKRFF